MRDLFPAVYSTLSPQALIERVLSHYEIGCIESCVLWNRGLSDVYLVKSAQHSYILRISHHHWRSLPDIDFELELLNFLHQRSLPVAYPIHTAGQTLFVTIPALEGDRYAALFPYAEGDVPLGDLDCSQAELFGNTLGKLHLNGQDFQYHAPSKLLTLKCLLDNSFKKIAPFLETKPQNLDYLQRKISEIKDKLSNLPQEAPYWGVCWGDPHSGNSHFTTDNEITIFDFDQCGYGWRAFDIAKFLQVSLSAGINRKVRDAFFAGYLKVQAISEIEINCLQALTQTAHIWNWAINIEGAAVHCWSRLDNSYFHKRIEQLKMLDTDHWQLF